MKDRFAAMYHLLWIDLKRSVLSWKFFFSVICVTGMMFAAVKNMMNENGSVWYYMCLSLEGSGAIFMAMCVLPVFPFGISFASEWEQRAHGFWMIRSGVRSYAYSKIIISFLSGFLVVFVGIGLFVLCTCTFAPMYFVEYIDSPYEYLIIQGQVGKGFLLYMCHQSLGGGLIAVCGMYISTLLPDPFVSATAPLVIYFTLLRLTGRLSLPPFMDPIYWNGGLYYLETAEGTLGMKFATVAVLCLLMGIYTKKNIEGRILRE